MSDGLEHEESLGSDDPGSMAHKLAKAAASSQKVELEPDETARQDEAEAAVAAEAIAAEQAAAEATAQGEAPPEPPKRKFDNLEDYDKAYKEAETKMHMATEEAATERKAREALETEAELTRKELAELKVIQETAATEAAKLVPKAERKAAYADALEKIRAIPWSRDPETGEVVYPDDYHDQVAEVWAETAVDPHEVAKEAAKLAREELKRERAAEEKMTAEEKAVASRAQVRSDAEKIAAEQGLDMTPGSADHRLFWTFANELRDNPEHEYRDKPFAEQVKWATGGVRQVLGKKIELTDAERETARKTQERNAVLERGVTRTAPPEPKRQRTMAEILGQSQSS